MIRTDLIAPIGELVRRHAGQRGHKLAFEDAGGTALSYAELEARSAALAGHLQDRGLQAGDTVAILLPNCVDWVLACVAIARAGAVSVPISHDAVEAEIRYRLEDSRCAAVIVSPQHLPLVRRLQRQLPALRHLLLGADTGVEPAAGEPPGEQPDSLAVLARTPARSAPRDPQDVHATAFIVYTSGTTGRAKGVMLSQHSMLWVVAACWAPIAGLCESDRVLSPLPLFHSYALNISVMGILATGASEFLLPRFSTQDVLARLRDGGYTLMPGVPTMFHYLLEGARAGGRAQAASIRYFLSAGAIMPASLNRDFEATFGKPLLDGYGITETSTMVTLNWPGAQRVMGSCGLPLPGLAVRIVDTQGRDVAPGEQGELIVRGPNVMQGYLNKPAETAAALLDGWYRTGDLARSDANGLLAITGRLKELIIRGGQNIAPAEVEEAVLSHPDVLDCAVLGVAHPQLGEVPVACIVARDGRAVDVESIRSHCAGLLSVYKVPHAVHLVPEVPRTGSGKIMRFRLRDALAGLAPG